MRDKIKDFIEINLIIEDGRTENYRYLIVDYSHGDENYGYNGYVIFDHTPLYDNQFYYDEGELLQLIPVHGGLNYARQFDDGFIYGFDTHHCDSNKYPFRDINWIKEQIDIKYKGIVCIAEYEKKYRESKEYKKYKKAEKKYFDLKYSVMSDMKDELIRIYGRN